MKNFIELKYHKNSKQEIVFENLDEIKEGDNVVLRLKELDLTVLFYLNDMLVEKDIRLNSLFIPHLCNNYNILNDIDDIMKMRVNKIFTIDNTEISKLEPENIIKNILPKWNIPEDSAVLFLTKRDRDGYNYRDYIMYIDNELCMEIQPESKYPDMSIIIPEIHAEDKNCRYHIENINKVCKELKEKYGVERIELFVSHCFGYIDIIDLENFQGNMKTYNATRLVIDKITTTNSTGMLEVKKSDRLDVVDCVEFFNI